MPANPLRGLADAAKAGHGPAARASLEPALLRRYRHADRRGRHLVLPEFAHRPETAGAALRLGPAPRSRTASTTSSRLWKNAASASMTRPSRRFAWRSRARAGTSIIRFETNVDDEVTVDAAHPLRFVDEPGTGGLKPYVTGACQSRGAGLAGRCSTTWSAPARWRRAGSASGRPDASSPCRPPPRSASHREFPLRRG